MKQTTANKTRLIFGWCFFALTVLVGALFILQTLDIYLDGLKEGASVTYSRAIVGAHLREIAFPVVLWLLSIGAGVVLWKIFPEEEKKLLAAKDERKTLKRTLARLPLENSAEGAEFQKEYALMRKERRVRLIVRLIVAAVVLVYAVGVIAYLLSDKITIANEKHDVWAMAVRLLPLAIVVCVVAYAASVYADRSVGKELQTAKSLLALYAKKGVKLTPRERAARKDLLSDERVLLGVRLGVAAVGIVLVVVGVFNGGMNDVLNKAILICQECIGLG